jgi:hypothetical protein
VSASCERPERRLRRSARRTRDGQSRTTNQPCLFHMAQIAWELLMGVKATTSASGAGAELDILPWQFEQIQFAVAHTMSLASKLEAAFQKEFEGETAQ